MDSVPCAILLALIAVLAEIVREKKSMETWLKESSKIKRGLLILD